MAKLDAYYYCPYLSPNSGGTHPEYAGWSSRRKTTGVVGFSLGDSVTR